MRFLLDTQTVVLWLKDAGLSPKVRRTLRRPGIELWVSIVTPWEIVLKPQLRRTGLTLDRLWFGVEQLEAELLPIRKEHIVGLAELPSHADHRDPFDRMLVAQALSENLTLVGADTRFQLYHGLKVLW
ncbi:MAG: type II toxin-antitoxin system VapC family toxin [Acidobacteriaceae bacterium]|nr:type II toxin-antitoxin system VapC family toxin [Acidobacteriaceae bacterium]